MDSFVMKFKINFSPWKGTVSIENHLITYTSFYSRKVPKWIRLGSFAVKLPSLLVVYVKCAISDNEVIRMDDKNIVCSNDAYGSIVITIGEYRDI